MFEDMTCTSTKINVLFMDVDQTAICLGTRKDANDVTEFKIDKIIAVRPKMPKDNPANRYPKGLALMNKHPNTFHVTSGPNRYPHPFPFFHLSLLSLSVSLSLGGLSIGA